MFGCKCIVFLSFLTLLALRAEVAEGRNDLVPGPPSYCLRGPYHKDTPSSGENGEFQECRSWDNGDSCCSVATTESIRLNKARDLYNYTWDLCGTLSPKCEKFIKDEECFYQCEPMLGYFQINTTGYIQGVPVCADYCDAWFKACKNDLTCVENWLADFDDNENGSNICPADSSCVTFSDMYGNGEGLCNRMWGSAFVYSTDRDNCTVMAFNSSLANPNTLLSFPRQQVGEMVTPSPTMVVGNGASVSAAACFGFVAVMMMMAAMATN